MIAVRIEGLPPAVTTHTYPGARDMVRFQSTQTALDRIRRMLTV